MSDPMKSWASSLGLLTVLLFATTCAHPPATPPPAPPPVAAAKIPGAPHLISAPVQTGPKVPAPRPKGSCKVNGDLQDLTCTPGVISPLVTQANIQQTICSPGYSTQIRKKYAPQSYTNKLKVQQIQEYGYSDTNTSDYEEDHLISLELGGHPNDPRNLWPEPGASPNAKDKIEGLLNRRVCSGAMTLEAAQIAISTNWKAVQ